jgi:hypothetical protein
MIPSYISLFFLSLSLFLFSCEEEKSLDLTGRVAYIDLEGGFYGIYGDDGVSYDPTNLPADFQKDSLRVLFNGTIITEGASYHMWGKTIKLNKIERLR